MVAEPTLHPGRALAIDGMSSSDEVALVRRGFEAMAGRLGRWPHGSSPHCVRSVLRMRR